MSVSARLAARNLTAHRGRLMVSVGGVALALSLTLALDAIFTGVADQLGASVARAGADVWVGQQGVRNLHMVASWLPAQVTDRVREVDGVAAAEPILYATDSVAAGEERGVAYVIGLVPGATMGGPAEVVEGSARPGRGEIVVDRGFARRAGVTVGDTVGVLGGTARIAGLSVGTATLVNSVAYVPFDDFLSRRGGASVVSFVLVRVAPGASPGAVAADIERRVPGVTAQTGAAFADQERRLIMDMSADVIAIMSAIGFAVGLAVVALTVYVATLSRRREYGVLKALGARTGVLYGTVLAQAALSVAVGFVVASILVLALAAIVPVSGVDLRLTISEASLVKVAVMAAVIAGLAAVLPIRQVARVDPATVYRKGAAT